MPGTYNNGGYSAIGASMQIGSRGLRGGTINPNDINKHYPGVIQGQYNRQINAGIVPRANVSTPFWTWTPSRIKTSTSRVTPVEPEADRQQRLAREAQTRSQQEKARVAQSRTNRKKAFNDAFIKARNSGQMYFKFSDGKVYNTALSKDDQDWLKLNDNSSEFKMNINPLKVVDVKTIAGQTGQPYLPQSEDEQIYQI